MLHRLKNLLAPPEAKASRVARLIQLETGGRARWTPRDYAALAREGFCRNAVVHRAVKLVAENVGAAPFLVYEGAQARDKHPLTDLLARPNPRQDGASFLEAVAAYLLIAGNSYLEAVTLDTVRELYALRPDRMRVVPGADGWAQAYDYTVAGSTVRFEQSASPPPILHLTLFNPLDDHYGLGALEAAAVAIEGGDGHLRYKLSKESAAKTLSLLLQDNFSGRAEIGLTGDDDLHVKVSADGAAWLDAITVDRTSGKLTLGQGFASPAAARAQVAAAPLDALAHNGMQINGGMGVSQENGTSAITLTATGSAQTKYLLDQWMVVYRGSFVAAAQQVTDAPAGYSNSLKFTVSTAQSSLGANDELSISQPIEGYRVSRLAFGNAAASPLALGFWVKAHRTGTYSGSVRNVAVGGASPRAYPFTFTVNAADTWEFKTVTLAGDVTGTWGGGANAGLYLTICLAGGSSRVTTAAAWAATDASGATSTTNGVAATTDVFQLAGVIILPGIELPSSDRAALIMRPFDQETSSCRRYFQRLQQPAMRGVVDGSNASRLDRMAQPLCPVMRAAPSGVLNGTVIVSDGYTGPSISSIFANFSTTDVAEMDFLLSAALVSGRPAVVLQAGTGSIDLLARL